MTPRAMIVIGAILLALGVWIGITEVYTFGHTGYCGAPLHPASFRSDEADCSAAMGNRQLYTWLLVGAGLATMAVGWTRQRTLNAKKSPLPPAPTSA